MLKNIKDKQAKADEMAAEMVDRMKETMLSEIGGASVPLSQIETGAVVEGDGWTMHHGDCVDVVSRLESDSIGYSVFSPPFASLYTYSDDLRDMGNCADDDEFFEHFKYLIPELYRVTKPGRLLSFHCMDLPTSKARDGFIGLKDFRGDLIRAFTDAGWILHSQVCIWKDPVTAMQR
ncbi:MAG: helicase, partial [Planctomycetes bacterium]|nr:helicase [Planctomycetota bacterium]